MQIIHIPGITGEHIADGIYRLFMLLDQFGESLFLCVHLHFVYLLDRQLPEKLYDTCDFFEKLDCYPNIKAGLNIYQQSRLTQQNAAFRKQLGIPRKSQASNACHGRRGRGFGLFCACLRKAGGPSEDAAPCPPQSRNRAAADLFVSRKDRKPPSGRRIPVGHLLLNNIKNSPNLQNSRPRPKKIFFTRHSARNSSETSAHNMLKIYTIGASMIKNGLSIAYKTFLHREN